MSNTLLTRNPSLAHNSVLQAVCAPLKQLGINFFGYTAVDSNNNAYCLGSKPDYALEYLKQNFAQNDVHYHSGNTRKKYDYLFWDFLEKDRNTEALYKMAASFDQSHTLTISSQNESLNQCYHFSAPLHNEGVNQLYLEKLDILHSFIEYFKQCLVDIPELAAVYKTPVNINVQSLNKYEKTRTIHSDPRRIQLSSVALKRLRFNNSASYYLTKNEFTTLHWLRWGKSADMIAAILGVSRKTIERHIAAIKEKLDCHTLFQMGEKIATSGLSQMLTLSNRLYN